MITSKYMNLYADLALKVLHTYSPDTIIEANDFMSSDEAVLKMEEILSTNPSESELLDKIHELQENWRTAAIPWKWIGNTSEPVKSKRQRQLTIMIGMGMTCFFCILHQKVLQRQKVSVFSCFLRKRKFGLTKPKIKSKIKKDSRKAVLLVGVTRLELAAPRPPV